ncbi:hypothetical protein MRB53_001916 [Persea americana]|uniref:Uncharacterized protein n=1 Tax=Persea americana TaxID=3435 RepID=A0ACC2MTE6_PERAE|nr:hypothetical protein MRB53_001916 [Persea americana]
MVSASNWSKSANHFIKLCADAGNLQACYNLGILYCLQSQASGLSLIAKVAIRSNEPAIYSLSLVQYNDRGRSWKDKDIRAWISLCARASFGHIDAFRELGHYIQDGYGVPQNIAEVRRFNSIANAHEDSSSSSSKSPSQTSSSSTNPTSMFTAK